MWNHSRARFLAGKVTAPIILSAALAVSIFLDEFLAVAGVLAGAALILTIVLGINQRNEPFDEIAEIVLHNEAQDSAWIETLRQQQQDTNESTLRMWRRNAVAVWIFLVALIIKLGYLAFVTLLRFLDQNS